MSIGYNPGFGSGAKLILSVYPKAMSLELRHEGVKTYRIEAAPRNSYSTLLVRDTFSYCRNLHADDFELYRGEVKASIVADNLVRAWAQSTVGSNREFGPGILICAGLKPTKLELDAALSRQKAYFNALINEADGFAIRGAGEITDAHRLAADWMGTNDRKWARPITKIDFRSCPFCQEDIRQGAIFCRFCQQDVAAWDLAHPVETEEEPLIEVPEIEVAEVALPEGGTAAEPLPPGQSPEDMIDANFSLGNAAAQLRHIRKH